MHSPLTPIRGPVRVSYNVSVPANTKAIVYIPAAAKGTVREAGGMRGVRFLRMANSTGTPAVPVALFEVGIRVGRIVA